MEIILHAHLGANATTPLKKAWASGGVGGMIGIGVGGDVGRSP